MTIGERLVQVMHERGYSITRLARESGIAYPTVKRMMQSTDSGYIYTLRRLCETMGVDLGYFFGGMKDG